MNSQSPTAATAVAAENAENTDNAASKANGPSSAASIPELVAAVYESAPAVERAQLLEQLLGPVGVMSLFGIAGGVFANIRFRSGGQDMHVRPEDIQSVRGAQIATLVNHVQQTSADAVDGLAQLLSASPLLSSSAAAAVLVTVLVQRASKRGASRALAA